MLVYMKNTAFGDTYLETNTALALPCAVIVSADAT